MSPTGRPEGVAVAEVVVVVAVVAGEAAVS